MAPPGIPSEAITRRIEPGARKFAGSAIPGIRLVAADRKAYRPVPTAVLLIDAIRRPYLLYP